MFEIYYTNKAISDIKKLKHVGLTDKTQEIIEIISDNPYNNPPPYEKLQGNLRGLYSRRINIQHRIVYAVYKKEHAVKIISMWSHYEH
jgi:Txe/YoeB family toxin of toxin-antitoxin system